MTTAMRIQLIARGASCNNNNPPLSCSCSHILDENARPISMPCLSAIPRSRGPVIEVTLLRRASVFRYSRYVEDLVICAQTKCVLRSTVLPGIKQLIRHDRAGVGMLRESRWLSWRQDMRFAAPRATVCKLLEAP
ncbi:hypothetical protein K437DRAFT_78478 [Tilletiaria anomala UBC 951]|uniref:Uncharacterized protein n=1 Tax=Tilletiaria anomala (strain ATCC 24038 / CBS 436.72 / UBC 951) TaxID=1037660 RepID=A0A066WDK9_TILAU|nr:uncharacterized protein K437DRAFT_78478 [Tilletiaria anomala UBC 951]KDN49189.1 hypothetical protein K437DRAFT_78478 [Tilletiaria anomala UBC 951]